MEFQITEAVELIQTLAETENITLRDALQIFVVESGLDVEYAAQLKGALFEAYTLDDMASDSLTKALFNVFVSGESVEDIQEVDTKETQEGTKYKIRVKDRQSGSSYVRYATREKIAELRANPNISSVELTDHGTTGEDDKGERTASAKGGGSDRDGDGKVESSSKEHAGVVHNAIQRKMGGKPDGQDTRKEEVELEEGKKDADLGKMKRQSNKHMKDAVGKRSKSDSDSKNKSFKMDGIRSAIERGEDPRRDTYNGKRTGKDGTHPPEDHRSSFTHSMKDRPAKEPGVKKESAWDQYLELRENRRAARAAGGYKDDSKKQTDPSKDGFTGISGSIKDVMKQSAAMDKEKAKKKVDEAFEVTDADEKNNTEAYKRYKAGNKAYTRKKAAPKVAEEWKPDPTKKRQAKAAKLGREEDIEKGKSKKYGRDEDKIKDLYRRRMAVDFKKKKSDIGEDFVSEADLVDAGRKSEGQRNKKKLSGEGVDNSVNVKLMPKLGESVVTDAKLSTSEKRIAALSQSPSLSYGIVAELAERMGIAEECCPKCGTPECTCEGKEEEKPKKKREPKAKLDEAGMPIVEYSENNARPGPSPEMINPGKDPEGDVGHMNPKGKPKRYKNKGEAPGDRRPNDPSGPDLPNEKGTVPNGSGV
jgi:hypothetical protein